MALHIYEKLLCYIALSIEVMVGSAPLLVLAFCVACIFCQLFELAQAQNRTQAATDPAEGVPLSLSLTHTQFITY